MRKSLITIGLAAASLATMAGLVGCGTAHLAAATTAPVTASPAAAQTVLNREYFTQDQTIVAFPPSMDVASAALGHNGNAEEVAVVYATAAGAASAVRWYQGQADSLGMTGIIVVTQVSPTAVTLFGDDVHMPQYMQQITGYN